MANYLKQLIACLVLLMAVPKLFAVTSVVPDLGNRTALEGFADGLIGGHMHERNATAGLITIVSDNKVLLNKAYGYADIEGDRLADANSSLFRIGSITKTFTYIAIMQLYEQGLISLEANVNDYLSVVEFPEAFGEPTTIKHLMTHSGGIEASFLGGINQRNKADIVPLETSLRSYPPAQVRAPGTSISYSNYGVTVLGRIVEEVSGLGYCEYVETFIFSPLNMSHSDVCESDDLSFRHNSVKAYDFTGGDWVKKPYEFIGSWAPAGSISSSGADMANYMKMQLNGGRFLDHQVLQKNTLEKMYSGAYTSAEGMLGMAHGFFEKDFNGYRALAHGGATSYFFSYMTIFPGEDIGIFYSFTGGNSGKDIRLPTELFMDRYFPERRDATKLRPEADVSAYTGTFRSMRMEYSKFSKLLFALEDAAVADIGGGKIEFDDGDQKKQYAWVSEGRFRSLDSADELGFLKNDTGGFDGIHFSARPYRDYFRVSWYENLIFSIFLCLLALLVAAYVLRRTVAKKSFSMLNVSLCSAALSALLLLGTLLSTFLSLDAEEIAFSGFQAPEAVLSLESYALGLTSLLAFSLACVSNCSVKERIGYAMLALPMVGLFWFSIQWNLLGLQVL